MDRYLTNVDTATKKWMWNIYLRVRISSKTYKSTGF